jgi:hypothetical protein
MGLGTFSAEADGGVVRLRYAVENTTAFDYEIASQEAVKVLVDRKDGFLSAPVSAETITLQTPVFIPSRKTGTIDLLLHLGPIPIKSQSENDEKYDRRLQAFIEEKTRSNVRGFVIFHDVPGQKYQIQLPRWSEQNSRQPPPQ